MELTYYGHSCFMLSDGVRNIIVDPFLNGNPRAAIKPANLPHIDLVLVTHGHGDHLGDAIEISKRFKAPIIAPFELALFCQSRGAAVMPMNHGGRQSLDYCSVKMTNAIHSSGFVDKGAEYTGNPCGYIVRIGNRCIYYTGDTDVFSDMKLLAQIDPVDVMVLPIGDVYTMGATEAAMAVDFVKPKFAIPVHYATFEVLDQSPDGFCAKVMDYGHTPLVLQPGETQKF